MRILNFILFFLSFCQTYAQNKESWSLQQCVDYALANNNTVRQADLNSELSKSNYIQNRLNNLPTVNGFASHSYNFGQTIDRYTNQFANERVQSNNFALSSNMNLFNGMQNYNNWQQNKFNYEASVKDAEKAKNDIVLNVVNAYLQILFAQEILDATRKQVQLTQKQVERTKRLVDAGSANKGILLNVESQLSGEELQYINAENNFNLANLNLALLLNMEKPSEFKVSRPNVSLPKEDALALNPDGVYTIAQEKLPEVKSAELRLKSAEYALASSRGAIYPTLSLNASIATGYSGLRKNYSGEELVGYQTLVAPDKTTVFYQPIYTYTSSAVQPFADQFSNNINKSVGLNLNVPIFNGWQVQNGIKRARINVMSQKLNYDNVKIQLRRNVQQASADALAAQKKYYATLKSNNAASENYKYTEQRYELGASNSFEYNDAKTRLSKADSDLLQAKYDYLFKVKILEFYQGKPLVIE
jgi:outer membrane protein